MPMELTHEQSLHVLHDVALSVVHDVTPEGMADISMRQLSVLLIIYLEAPPHTVRGLAEKLNVTKPVITRALNTMGQAGIVARRRDDADRRNVIVQRTVKGALYVEKLGDLVRQEISKPVL